MRAGVLDQLTEHDAGQPNGLGPVEARVLKVLGEACHDGGHVTQGGTELIQGVRHAWVH
jgi:hypothetical protein